MATPMKTAKSDIDMLNRYGIADAARTRITAQILRNVTKSAQKQPAQPQLPKVLKAKAPA